MKFCWTRPFHWLISTQVFAAEASLPGRDDARLGRAHLAESLGLCQDAASRELPLLFGLVATLQDQQAAARER